MLVYTRLAVEGNPQAHSPGDDEEKCSSPSDQTTDERPKEHPAMIVHVLELAVNKFLLYLWSQSVHGWPTFPLMTSMLGKKLMRRIIKPGHRGQFSTR